MRTAQAQLFQRVVVLECASARPCATCAHACRRRRRRYTPQNLPPPILPQLRGPKERCACHAALWQELRVLARASGVLRRGIRLQEPPATHPVIACWACLRCWSLTAGREQLPPASWRPRRSKLREPSGWCVLLLPGSGERTHATLCARRGLHTSAQVAAHAVPRRTAPQIINAGQAKPSPPVGPALGQVCAPLPRLYSTHACGAPSIHPSIIHQRLSP